jgi:hypothetical protein
MQKDVIYIDVEDDITAIIGKVKASSAKIVALVPPKRLGAIQSAVNLKLVHRAAEQADKHLVLISNNPALIALAASASIPVAKNLQSKPELAEVSALEVDDGEDVIDGSAIAAGSSPANGADATTVAEAEPATLSKLGATAAVASKAKSKIPNFDTFRKKLFIGIAAGVLLIGFLVWALVFAPHADIIVTARTSNSALTTKVTLADNLSTSLNDGTIKSVTKTAKKDVSVPVTATGKKDVGTKATGTVKFTTNTISSLGTIPAGTVLTSVGGKTYTTDQAVTLTIANASSGATTTVTATANGADYNGATGAATGAPSGVSASFVGSTSGGTDKTITVVQQSDVDEAMTNLVSESDTSAAKSDLKKQFGNAYIVLEDTFKQDTSGVKPNPAVDAEASDGKATLAGSVTFSMVAVAKSEASKFLDAYFAQQIDGKSDQKVYDNGLSALALTGLTAATNGYSANVAANGKIGPKIDDQKIKEYAKGKRFGEIQSYIQSINGVDNVDVKFSPFWVQSAPNDTNRIQVEFKVNG